MAEQTFYCDSCGDARGWPRKMMPEMGVCSICDRETLGNLFSSSILASIIKPEQLRFDLI